MYSYKWCQMRPYACGLLLLSIFVSSENLAEVSSDQTTYSLLDLYRKALLFDAEYRKAQAEHAASRELTTQAYANLRPSLMVDYQKTETRQETIKSDSFLFSEGITRYPSDSYSITLTQPLFKMENFVNISLAKLEVKRADVILALEKVGLVSRVLQRYLEALAAQDALDFASREQEAIKKQFELAKARFNAHIGRKADYFDAQSRYALVQANTMEAMNDRNDKLEGLYELTDIRPDRLAALDVVELVVPEPHNVDVWTEMTADYNLEIMQHRLGVEIARKQTGLEKSAHGPSLDLVARQARLDTEGTEFGAGREVETTVTEIRFQMPIYQGGKTSSRVRQRVRLHEAAIEELNKKTREVVRETRASFHGIDSAIKRIRSLEQAVEAQQWLVKTKKAGFPGVYNSLEVLDAETDFYGVKRDLSQARYDYILSSLKLKAVVGKLEERDIKSINSWLSGQDQAN